MKDSEGREISLSRLDMLTDGEIDQLKGDSWDDYCWKSGNQYARMVHEFCVIEQDRRIRKEEERKQEERIRKLALAQEAIQAKNERALAKIRLDMARKASVRPEPEFPVKEFKKSSIGPSGEKLKEDTIIYHGAMP